MNCLPKQDSNSREQGLNLYSYCTKLYGEGLVMVLKQSMKQPYPSQSLYL
jgi:hypothetical protein